ncbi:MAG: FAD-binding protein [Chloroflexi bacterium]|nr:FAD-binding protein [Chloroflexota bacterium]
MVAAVEAARAGARVELISSTELGGGSSERAQGGIAAALDDDDAPELHASDTLRAGRGLCRASAVDVLVREGPAWIEKLAAMGVPFGSEAGLEGGHTRRRIHHVDGTRTGHAVVAALARLIAADPRIDVRTGETVRSLLVADGRCVGALSERRTTVARATILATGGYAALFARTTNPVGSRGDGLMLAHDAGAALADLELVQFHPTVLASGALLLSEALRGEGALLLDAPCGGERFIDELAPRDEVARAIFSRGQAWLDLRPIDRGRFTDLIAALERMGHRPDREPIPVAPAAHYTMGGIVADVWGRTGVAGLFAVGECAATGVHGANRLASNSLLECAVFGGRAARAAVQEPRPKSGARQASSQESVGPTPQLRRALWEDAGVVRDPERLAALERDSSGLARQIATSALARAESRGSHYRRDLPTEDPSLAGHFVFRTNGGPVLEAWA